jgi:cbb3-type cytochrome oxidase subunit 3
MDGFASALFIVWLLASLVVFVGIVVWAMWPSNKARLQAYADIPLRDDKHEA